MTLFARIFVLITGIIWAGYGVAVLFFPEIISTITGIRIDNWPARLEVQSWYLVTEIALGTLSWFAFVEPQRYLRITLLIWLVAFTQLVLFRFIGTWYYDSFFDLRVGNEYLPYSYHIGTAYLYELPSMLVYVWLWLKRYIICTDNGHIRAGK